MHPRKDFQSMNNDNYTSTDETPVMASEPALANCSTSYTDAMMMIHTMHLSKEDKERVARRLLLETTEKNLSNAFDRLEHFSILEPGWGGEGSFPVSRRVIRNLKNVLLISDDVDWENWMLSPEPTGAVSLQSKKRRSSISVGDEEFSYYTKLDGQRQGKSHIAFTPAILLSVMREIEK